MELNMVDLQKIVQDLSALTVLEAAELSKLLEKGWGVSAAPVAMPAAASAAAAPAAAAEKTEFTVTLKAAGPDKLKVIKEVRVIVPGLGLTEAKKFVEEAPQVVKDSATKDEAQKIKEQLEAVGATVEIQ